LFLTALSFGCATDPGNKADSGDGPSQEETPVASALPQPCNPDSPCAGSTCPASMTSALAAIPTDACPRFGEFQSDVDVYSWNTFIALNWPANTGNCQAETSRSILSGAGPVVWETFALDSDVFVAEGSQPLSYCDPALTEGPRQFHGQRKVSATLAGNFPVPRPPTASLRISAT
jgi:hypothetical protein